MKRDPVEEFVRSGLRLSARTAIENEPGFWKRLRLRWRLRGLL